MVLSGASLGTIRLLVLYGRTVPNGARWSGESSVASLPEGRLAGPKTAHCGGLSPRGEEPDSLVGRAGRDARWEISSECHRGSRKKPKRATAPMVRGPCRLCRRVDMPGFVSQSWTWT